MKKATLKKLLLDTCTKTAFLFNGQLYEQTDGVSMGGSLGPLLAKIIMVELESKIIRPLIEDGTIKFYTRFVDDTLLLLKKDDIERVKAELERFDSNLKFTYDMFETENPHFLDIEITSNGLKIYRKKPSPVTTLISAASFHGITVFHGFDHWCTELNDYAIINISNKESEK